MGVLQELSCQTGYKLVRKIADGGMGVVYEARQQGAARFTKTIAIKIIREEYSSIAAFHRNFIGEAYLVADLIHTNIVQIYHFGKTGERYFMVQEFVRGINLQEFLFQHQMLRQPIPVDIAVFIISRVCRGLAYAHAKRGARGQPLNIVHRDISPKNILMAYEGDVKLTDFGIAKAVDLMYSEEGKQTAGRDEYLSPEQARRQVTDQRADLFSCGIILAELLMGHNIFEADDAQTTRRNILHMRLPDFTARRLDVDKALDHILRKALCRDRRRRYQTARELLLALETYLYRDGYGPTNEKLGTYVRRLHTRFKRHESSCMQSAS